MKQYNVTGMSCAACSTRVEKAVSKIPGVEDCSVSLLTNSMRVSGDVPSKEVIHAVREAGYDASEKKSKNNSGDDIENQESQLEDKETPVLKKKLIASVTFLIILMYFSMGHMMWGWPIPGALANNHIALGLIQMLLTIIVMVINQKFFINGFRSLLHRSPNMDTLVALGAGAAFLYSVCVLFAMTEAVMMRNDAFVMKYMDEFYFESAAMILTLISVGKTLEARAKGKTTDALKGLMKLAPKKANILIQNENGEEEKTVPIEQVKINDIFIVKPGEIIPVDGIVIEGSSAINEATLTGESIPVDKEVGDVVSQATINQSGFLKCEATRVGEDTTLSQIIQMVSDAATTKAPIAKVADKVSGIFVPAVTLIAIITFIVWLFVGETVGFSLARAISVLVISCPCALGLATPVAIMVGNGVGAKNGIMFKTATILEEAGKVDIVVLDKTGTITKGEPSVTDVLVMDGGDEAKLLKYANAIEKKSEHPLAKAIVEYAKQRNVQKSEEEIVDFKALPGNGLIGTIKNSTLKAGNFLFIKGDLKKEYNIEEIREKTEQLSKQGKTPLFFSLDGVLLGIIAVADTIKEGSIDAIKRLRRSGKQVVMLTGDNRQTAMAIGTQAGIVHVISDVMPDGKEEVIRKLQQFGKVAMVGDGINDAPALTRADVGIAIGAGTDIAIDSADIVLMKSDLPDVPAALKLSRATLTNIYENLFWAFIYNVIGIPLAAGVWIPIFGWELNPMFGAVAMSLSSFCVVANALRLNRCRINDDKKTHNKKELRKYERIEKEISELIININNIKMEKKRMEKILKIEGMMCGHCESRVKKTLEAFAEVEKAVVSHETGTACITVSDDVNLEAIKKALEDQDYKVISIEEK